MRPSTKLGLSGVVCAALLTACGNPSSGPQTHQVLVDYLHDQVASSFLMYFPRDITVHPGDTIEFRQEWTGEPHSVTMGTAVDEMMAVAGTLMEQYGDTPEEEIPQEALEQFESATSGLPWMFSDDLEDLVNQNAAQPCYLDEGLPPEDPATPCADDDQVQPAFNGRQSYYNSGFIPYEGPQGNKFTVALANDIEPGVYNYYCNLHGPGQSGTITVVDESQRLPSAREVARQAREEIDAVAKDLLAAYDRAKMGDARDWNDEPIPLPLAGAAPEDPSVHAFISEFIPETIRTEVGTPVTWSFIGPHTVSFRVPSYFSQITVEDDGTVIVNPDAVQPVNGPGAPQREGPPDGEGGEGIPGEGGAGEPPPVVDAGRWDGSEFISSGIFFAGQYSLTFTQPGTYAYACLIHPQMVGTVVVED